MKRSPVKILYVCILVLGISAIGRSQGGMWLPQLLEGFNENEMKDLGMEISASDIYNINKSSIKDAVVQFGSGCTAEIISDQGLILTNHHCAYGRIQAHSTLENNLLKNGFWAGEKAGELPTPGLTARMIDRIEDVTQQVLQGTESLNDEKLIQSRIDQNLEALRKGAVLAPWQEVQIRPFYYGNKYYMFISTVFEDIRLVGAPPESIGKFGFDTDNWVWPRHTGDFALFRIYVDPQNQPAKYSEENVPYRPKHHLPLAVDGVKEGDFTMILGFPARTREYLPAVGLEQILEVTTPARISVREAALKIMDKYMRQDEATRLQYAARYAGIANYWKKWIGQNQGLIRTDAVQKRKEQEEIFIERISQNEKLEKEYGHLLDEFNRLYAEIEPYAYAEALTYEATVRNIEMMQVIGYFDRLLSYYNENGEAAYRRFRDRLLPYLQNMYNDYRKDIDREIFIALTALYMDKMEDRFIPDSFRAINDPQVLATRIFDQSMLESYEKIEALLNQDSIPLVVDILSHDPAYITAMEWRKIYDEKITPRYNELQSEINALQKQYMKALMEVFPENKFYPDANSTFRLAYGQVMGYFPRDAVYYEHVTYLSGVIEKYIPGDYEFDIPARLLALHKNGDFGNYADETGDVPVCFIGTNHGTNGNSGSPVLDAHGNLIGVHFDRVWEGTMSDLHFDPSICRNIMLDVRYILFIIDKFAGAGHLIEEMNLVYPKSW